MEEWGTPKKILTDNGREFKNDQWEKFCEMANIQFKHGSPYTPTTQGCVERFNQTLMNKLRKITEFGREDWAIKLPEAVIAYNNSFSRAINCTPAELIGEPLIFPIDNKYNIRKETNKEELIALARMRLEQYQKGYSKQLSDSDKTNNLEIGSKVWYNNPTGKKDKLSPINIIKAKVIDKRFQSYKIKTEDDKIVIANYRQLRAR